MHVQIRDQNEIKRNVNSIDQETIFKIIGYCLTIIYYFLRYEKHRAFTITIILFTGIVVVASALIEFPEINIRIYET